MTTLAARPGAAPRRRHRCHVWVETDRPLPRRGPGHGEPTWTVAGHHYALVRVDRPAEPAARTEYQVRLDGELAWPRPDDPPAAPADPHHRAGTHRSGSRSVPAATPGPTQFADDPHFEPDALVCLARDLPGTRRAAGRTRCCMLGDQVYADETTARHPGTGSGRSATSPRCQGAGRRLRGIHLAVCRILDRPGRPLAAVHAAHLDDLRRSRRPRRLEHLGAWRQDMQAHRLVAGADHRRRCRPTGSISTWATSSPAELADDELYQQVRRRRGDAEPLLREFATRPTARPTAPRAPAGPTGATSARSGC